MYRRQSGSSGANWQTVVNLDYYSTPVAEVAEPTDLNHLFVGARN
jgi:hypothetical protein